MISSLAEIVAEIEAAKTPTKQAELLKKFSSAALKCIVGYALDPKVKWLLPEGDPSYKALEKATDSEGVLHRDYKKLLYLIDSSEGRNVSSIKRETLFIQLLESVVPDDAKLLLRIKNKDLNISPKAVKMAWPSTASEW